MDHQPFQQEEHDGDAGETQQEPPASPQPIGDAVEYQRRHEQQHCGRSPQERGHKHDDIEDPVERHLEANRRSV